MTASIFDTHQAVRRLEAAGIETPQAEAIISEMRDAAGADRGELYRALWIQGAGIVAIPTALRAPADLTFPAHSRTSQAP